METITVRGYDIIATAQVMEGGGRYGEVLVLNNNSDSYLVVLRESSESEKVKISTVYKYDDTDVSLKLAYQNALRKMVELVLVN